MTWVWLSCSFHLVRLISHLLFSLRPAMALVVVVESCFHVWGWNKKGGFLEEMWNRKRWIFGGNRKLKKWIFRENLVFLLNFSPRGDTSPLLMPSGLLPEDHKHQLFGEHDWLWPWTLQPFMGAASGLTGTFIPAGKLEFSWGTEAAKPKGEMSRDLFSRDLFHPGKGRAGA